MGKVLAFRRRVDIDVGTMGGIGPAPWDVVEYVPREQLRPARTPRGPKPPWPVYRGMHGRGRLVRDAAAGSLALLTLLGALVAARAGDAVLAGILVGLAALRWGYWARRLRQREEELAGERRLERELIRLRARLPWLEDAVLLCDVVLEVEGQRWQFDALLLTPACALVLEAKHWAGRQTALPDGRWRSDGDERPSPAAQAVRQARLLATWLAARGIRRWPVVALVVFTHPRVRLEADDVPAGIVTLSGLGGAVARELATRLPALTPQEVGACAAALIAADAGL